MSLVANKFSGKGEREKDSKLIYPTLSFFVQKM